MLSCKINRAYHKVFKHCNLVMPNGKVLHLGRTLDMNYAKDNNVNRLDTHSMTVHKTGDQNFQVVEENYHTPSYPTTTHVISGTTDKKEWKLNRTCCSTHYFESMVHPKKSSWIQQRESINGDKTDDLHDSLNHVLPNDARVITQDGKFHQVLHNLYEFLTQ